MLAQQNFGRTAHSISTEELVLPCHARCVFCRHFNNVLILHITLSLKD